MSTLRNTSPHIVTPLKAVFILLVSLFYSQFLHAQAEVQANVDKQQILLGEPFKLHIMVRLPLEHPGDTIGMGAMEHFEIVELSALDATKDAAGIQLQRTYTLTSFDSGRWAIPPFSIAIDEKVYRSDSIYMNVTFSADTVIQEYHDLKDIQAVVVDTVNYWWIVAAVVLLLALLLFWWWKKRKHKDPVIQRYTHLSPYEEAMKLLDDLEKEPLSSKEKYTRLTYIFRIFLHRKNGWNAMRKSSMELYVELEKSKLSQDDYLKLGQTLRLSNMVKFAKYEPVQETDKEQVAIIRQTITSLNSES